MNCEKSNDFVPNGRWRVFATEEYQRKHDEVRASVTAKYHDEYAQSHFLKRLLIRMRIEREIKHELEKLAPPDAMYFSRSEHT